MTEPTRGGIGPETYDVDSRIRLELCRRDVSDLLYRGSALTDRVDRLERGLDAVWNMALVSLMLSVFSAAYIVVELIL